MNKYKHECGFCDLMSVFNFLIWKIFAFFQHLMTNFSSAYFETTTI